MKKITCLITALILSLLIITINTKAEQTAIQTTEITIKKTVPIPNTKTSPGDSTQVLLITTDKYGTYKGKFIAYELIRGKWTSIYSGTAVTGLKGFSGNRKEGDKTTPTGKYDIAFMFGSAKNPGVKFEYRKTVKGDYWVSNYDKLSEYNIWVHYEGTDIAKKYDNYDELYKQPLFKYAAVINFNYSKKKVLNKGSGIFLHIAPSNGGGTLGCVGIKESELVKVLKWMDPKKKAVIIMGVKGKI